MKSFIKTLSQRNILLSHFFIVTRIFSDLRFFVFFIAKSIIENKSRKSVASGRKMLTYSFLSNLQFPNKHQHFMQHCTNVCIDYFNMTCTPMN